MTTRLNALGDRTTGQAFGLTNYDNLEADVNYLTVAGANLAAAATLNITSEFHIVTGTTTVQTLTDALGQSVGQQVKLLFQSTLKLSGSAGNIRTISGQDRYTLPNEIVTFTYDGTNWQEGELAPGLYKIWDSTESGIAFPAASIVTPTLPQSFKGLRVIVSALNSSAASAMRCRINGDTSANYASNYTTERGSGVASGEELNSTTSVRIGTAPAAFPSASEIVFPNYANTLYKKSNAGFGGMFDGTDTWAYTVGGAWSGTAAIQTLTFLLDSGSFAAGTRITVYGEA